ncbi:MULTISPECIES: hypothetical protein [unclassified Streptomyces]|uniref:hypothetical protein n=1 Tax=unclassified Streptomyces TaxID=2593676 RepID=UPI0009A0EAFD|nr:MULTISPECIES: hypothetical protein [unclassified Streptomyces]
MSEISIPVGHEAYAFACMRCGYGWEQTYAIEHHTDATGRDVVVYRSGGRRVPSPLSPTCPDCGKGVVRIMGPAPVPADQEHGRPHARPASPPDVPGMPLRRATVPTSATEPAGATEATAAAGPADPPGAVGAEPQEHAQAEGPPNARRGRVSGLLHGFRRR